MKYTQNLNMKIPEGGDPIDIVDITENFETLDIEINKKANTSGGDISDTTIKTVDAIATEFPVPSAGESSKTFLGKIRKFIQDFIAIKDTLLTLSKLVNNGQTTASGFALDARYGKTLADQITKLNTDLTTLLNKNNSYDLTVDTNSATILSSVRYAQSGYIGIVTGVIKAKATSGAILSVPSKSAVGVIRCYISKPFS